MNNINFQEIRWTLKKLWIKLFYFQFQLFPWFSHVQMIWYYMMDKMPRKISRYKTTNVVITTFSWHVFYFQMTKGTVHDDVKDVHMDPWKWNLYITQASKWLGIDIRYDSDYIICWSIHHHDNYVPSFLVLALILILYSLETPQESTYFTKFWISWNRIY